MKLPMPRTTRRQESYEEQLRRAMAAHRLEREAAERARLHPDTFDWSAAPKFSQVHAGTGRTPVEVQLPRTMSPALFDLISLRCSAADARLTDR